MPLSAPLTDAEAIAATQALPEQVVGASRLDKLPQYDWTLPRDGWSVYPTAELALAASWDAPPAGYGSIPYVLGWRWLDALLDRFRDWDGGDLVGALTDRLPSGPGGSSP